METQRTATSTSFVCNLLSGNVIWGLIPLSRLAAAKQAWPLHQSSLNNTQSV